MAVNFSIKEVLATLRGSPLEGLNENFLVSGVSTDSRTVARGDLFYALKGERFDAHDFLNKALEKGVKNFVISDPRKIAAERRSQANFICVNDTLKAYGDLAAAYRKKFMIPVIAVTGSSGKTTVKELITHLLTPHFEVLKNHGTENNLVGVPKTIFCLENSHEALILELGTNRPGEIDRLAAISAPGVAVLTQIGSAHLEGLGNLEGVRQEKLALVKRLETGGTLFLNGEDPRLRGVESPAHRVSRVGFSKKSSALCAEDVQCHEKGSSFIVSGNLFQTQLLGRHNVLNCLLAMAVARSLEIAWRDLRRNLKTFEPVRGRLFERIIEGIYFIDDSYNSNPGSFRASLEMFEGFNQNQRKGLVCGDMLELGSHAETCHREMGALVAQQRLDFVIAAGPWCKFLVEEALKNGFQSKRIYHANDSAEAGGICRELAKAGDRILVKGSRGTQMEKVFECFITSSTR